MGNGLNTDGVFSIPPLVITQDLGQWEFLKENSWWPFVHVRNPFILFIYTRSWPICLLAMGLNEIVEAVVRAITTTVSSDSIVIDQIAESTLDSLLGDMINGILGVLMADFFLRAIRWPYHFLPYDTWGNATLGILFRYIFQFILLSLPLNFSGITFADGRYSLGYIIELAWSPILILIIAYWNRLDPLWEYVKTPIRYSGTSEDVFGLHFYLYYHNENAKHLTLSTTKQYYSHRRQKFTPGIRRFYYLLIGFLFLFSISFFYRYTHTFLMAVIHSLVFTLILYTIWMNQPLPRKQDF